MLVSRSERSGGGCTRDARRAIAAPRAAHGSAQSPRLQVHVDCDLYSSSLYVLTMLHKLKELKPIILMDDFSSPNHMFRAFDDYTSAYRVDFDYLASCGEYYSQVCVQLR